jgi:hypothetical protein
MKYTWMLAAMMLLPVGVMAQKAAPLGTIIPVQLDKDINTGKVHAGQEIKATVTQGVPGTQIRKGSKVLGQIVRTDFSQGGKAQVEFRFNALNLNGKRVPLVADLRVLASPIEIEDAQSGMYGPDAGVDVKHEITRQIGGGVMAQPRAQFSQLCRGVIGGNSQPQAMWLFSSDACGVYGYGNIKISHAGRTDPVGDILLTSESKKLVINSRSGMLLRVED